MPTLDFVTCDVFTTRRFSGNQLAVLPDASGLDGAQMQAIAAEFNYSETTFVLPPADAANLAAVRIFTPRAEIGTTYPLATACGSSSASFAVWAMVHGTSRSCSSTVHSASVRLPKTSFSRRCCACTRSG